MATQYPTLLASKSQFQIQGGATSCTSAACIFARYVLEKVPTRVELDRILDAGAKVWEKWSEPVGRPSHMHWMDVKQTWPEIFDSLQVISEINGFLTKEPLDEKKNAFMLENIRAGIGVLTEGEKSRSAVMTSNASSYGLGYRGEKFFFFGHN